MQRVLSTNTPFLSVKALMIGSPVAGAWHAVHVGLPGVMGEGVLAGM